MKKYNISIVCIAFLVMGFASCMKKGLEDLPEFTDKAITGVSAVEYRYESADVSPVSGQNLVKFITMNNVTTIDTATRKVNIKVSKPSSFPKSEADKLSLKNLVVIVNISTAARIAPKPGSPVLGAPGDWSKPNQYTITAADGSARDWEIALELIANKYEGLYTLTGSMVDVTASTLTGFYPDQVSLVAQSATSVAMYDMHFNDFVHHILSSGSGSYYGQFCPVFTFDASDKVIKVENKYGQPSSNGRSAELDPSGVNKYDPATKVLKVKYWMNQPGSTHRTSFDETFTLN